MMVEDDVSRALRWGFMFAIIGGVLLGLNSVYNMDSSPN